MVTISRFLGLTSAFGAGAEGGCGAEQAVRKIASATKRRAEEAPGDSIREKSYHAGAGLQVCRFAASRLRVRAALPRCRRSAVRPRSAVQLDAEKAAAQ